MADSNAPDHPSLAEPTLVTDLRAALKEGDLPKVQSLIAAGADIRYKTPEGYDALLDAAHGRDSLRNPQLLDLLALLVAHGVDLAGVTTYGESALRSFSWSGRFDAIRFLLDAGANKRVLKWTPLMAAVALGSLADVQAALAQGAALEEQDMWERTAWLIALLTGDIAKAQLLREWGANPEARGRCGSPPLFYAIQGHHPALLRWLLQEGADIHQVDEFGATALIEAVEADDLACVEILLDAGADSAVAFNGTALSRASSPAIILRLLDADADPADANQRVLLGLPHWNPNALDAITPAEFQRAYSQRFGKHNPERMDEPFWATMIRAGVSAYTARTQFERYGPFTAPIWSANRFGQSLTLLPDGRAVQIGGEHEDFYDPDFCIYNDVFVYARDRSVAIYGYPESIFPPTDFHTATLVGDAIYVIGGLGYRGRRHFGTTPVYRLNIHTLQMERLSLHGEAPGWLYKHRARFITPHVIRVWGGEIITKQDNGEAYAPNLGVFTLDLERLLWRRE